MAFAFVQEAHNHANLNGSNAITATFGAGVTAGNVIVGHCWGTPNGLVISSITLGANTVNTVDTLSDVGTTREYATFILGNVPAGGPTVVTLTFTSGSGNGAGLVVCEYSGGFAASNPIDGTAHNLVDKGSPGTGTDAIKSTSITTATNGDLIFSVCLQEGSATATQVAGTGFTGRTTDVDGVNNVTMLPEDETQGTAGAIQSSFTDATNGATNTYIVSVIAIKPVAAAGLPPGKQSFDTPQPDRDTARFPPQLRGFDPTDRFRLIAQDKLNPGKQLYDRQSDPLDPFAQWRHFSGHYILELIGKDKFNPGQQLYDRQLDPADAFAQWRTFYGHYLYELQGLDKFNPGAQCYALPDAWYAPERWAQWRAYSWQYSPLILVGLPPPGAQLYARWIDPQDNWAQWRDYSWQYRPILVGQDKLNPGKQLYDTHPAWLIPDQWAQQRSYSWQYNPLLHPLVVAVPPGVQLYDRTFDPQDSFSAWRSFAWTRPQELIFQDKFPVGAIWDDLSPRPPQQGIDFVPTVNIALLTQVVVPKPAGAQLYDNPPSPLDIWAQWRSFSWHSPNLALQDSFPPGVQTNFLPFGPTWRPESPQTNLFMSTLQALPPGGRLYDRSPDPQDPFAQWRGWVSKFNNLVGQDSLLPGKQTNYLPEGITWRPESPPANLLPSLRAFIFPIPPGKQLYDRALDPQDSFAYWRAWAGWFNLNLQGKDAFPPGAKLYERALDPQDNWAQFRSYIYNLTITFPIPPLPPGKQSFDLSPFGYPPLVAPWTNYTNPLVRGIPIPPPSVIPIPATYYLLEDLYINDHLLQAGTIQTTADLGGALPINWVPNPNVDPVDANAVAAYRAVGFQPRGLTRTQFTPLTLRPPNYTWQIVNGEPVLVKTGNF